MRHLFGAIEAYALAREQLEQLRQASPELMPGGENLPVAAAEFYALLFARCHHPSAKVSFTAAGDAAARIRVSRKNKPVHTIQVRAASPHTAAAPLARIDPGWDELHLVRLDKLLYPVGFWTMPAAELGDKACEVIVGARMPDRMRKSTGSLIFRRAQDRLADLQRCIEQAKK